MLFILFRYSTTDDMLEDYYKQWGQVVDAIVMRDPNSKLSRGFGFVTYAKSCMVDAAMQERPHIINGKVNITSH